MVDKLVAECNENVDEVKIAEINSTELHSAGHENVRVCSYTICVILAVKASAISIRIGASFVTRIKFGKSTQWNCAQTAI